MQNISKKEFGSPHAGILSYAADETDTLSEEGHNGWICSMACAELP